MALKYLSKLEDSIVHEICLSNWFQQDHGMEENEWRKAAKEMGLRLRRLNLKKRDLYRAKLSHISKIYSSGKYIIYTPEHLFVLDNGKIIDPLNGNGYGPDRIVTGVWKLLEK